MHFKLYTRIIITGMIISSTLSAQNLVLNPSFEDYSSCPTFGSQINLATPWIEPNAGSTSDYYNQCHTGTKVGVPNNWKGQQAARTGVGYAGFYPFDSPSSPVGSQVREYVQSKLDLKGKVKTLTGGTTYCVDFYVCMSSTSRYPIDNIGAYFSNGSVTGPSWDPLPYMPQVRNPVGNIIDDTTNWILISGSFVAVGDEDHITIGNFSDNSGTNYSDLGSGLFSYYFLDDVNVYVCTPLPIELISFNATVEHSNIVQLKWQTESESNNDDFEVQRSKDGVDFKILDKVPVTGNSDKTISYNYIDENPLNGFSYYRLKQVDFEGNAAYSKVVQIDIIDNQALQLRRYQSGNTINIEYSIPEGGEITLSATSIFGAKLFETTRIHSDKGLFHYTVDANRFPEGICMITVFYKGEYITGKILIHR